MKKVLLPLFCFHLSYCAMGQTVTQKLQAAWKQFENDPQLSHAISSLYVVDATTGGVLFDRNGQTGLAPASTQKIITAAAAYALLGKDYRYKTELRYNGQLTDGFLIGDLFITGKGDPTLGSWRWDRTNAEKVIGDFTGAMQRAGIRSMKGHVYVDISEWEDQSVNDRWIWQDIGNYYGSGISALPWRENQFDIHLRSGDKVGDLVSIRYTVPTVVYFNEYTSALTSGPPGSGDQAYAYIAPRVLRGTIPVKENDFVIGVSLINGPVQLAWSITDSLKKMGFGDQVLPTVINQENKEAMGKIDKGDPVLYTAVSPSLDTIIYWLNKKSINLYAEALLKTMAFEKKGFGTTENGINTVKDFWKGQGIDPGELNIYDGSGLSPMNRVTTHAQVQVLQYARKQEWYSSFVHSLPEYNGMSMKSGTIGDVKAFTGIQKAKNGREYLFSFIVNNYNGSSSALVGKMYKVLNNLK